MAEIKVEPKRGGLGWLWAIIILALIAAAIWYFMTNRTVPATTQPVDSTRTSMIGPAVAGLPTIDAIRHSNVEGGTNG